MNSFESVIKGDYTILSWDFAEGGHMVRRWGGVGNKSKYYNRQKKPATMINNCINESLVTSFQQYRETRRKCRPQALVKPKMWSVLQGGYLSSTQRPSAQPQPASPAAAGALQGWTWTEACPGHSRRGALRALQELGGAGPPPGVSGWHRWCGAPGQDPPASTMWKGKKGEQRPWVWIDEKDAKYNYTM